MTIAPEPKVPVVEPVPTWIVPAAMVNWPEKLLEPSRMSVPAVVLLIAPPPLISVTLRSVPDSRLTVLIGRVSVPMVKPFRSREALARRRVEVTEAKPLPMPLAIELRTSTVPPVMLSAAVETPATLVEPPSVTGPLMVTLPPEMLTVPTAELLALLEVFAATFKPVAPMVTVPPRILIVPVEAPVLPLVPVLRRSATITEVTSSVPALMLKVPVMEPPLACVRPAMASVLARMSTV